MDRGAPRRSKGRPKCTWGHRCKSNSFSPLFVLHCCSHFIEHGGRKGELDHKLQLNSN